MNELPDPLMEWLQPVPNRQPASLQARLRDQTSRLVRRRLLVRRLLAAAGAAAACLLVAAATVYLTWPPPQPLPQPARIVVEAPQPPEQPAVAEEVQPVVLEWRAFDSKANRAADYFLAGNKYLEASQDVESALRCYVQALDACAPAELAIASDDNWLVVTLKNARTKEKAHE